MATAPTQFYSPDFVTFTLKGKDITGFADGTFIEVERKEDGFTEHVGSKGDVVRTQNLNRLGEVKLTLMAQHPSNSDLQAIADLDEKFGTGVGELQIQDHSGNMLVHAAEAWIKKRPKIDRAKESGNTQWVITCAELEIDASGNS